MRDAESQAAWVVCPWCDEKKCVGRYNCKQIAAYLKIKEKGEMEHDSSGKDRRIRI